MSVWRLYALAAAVLAVLAAGWAVHHRIDAGGYDRCRDELALATQAAEKAEQARYLAALDWGNQVSAQLAASQRQITDLRSRHADYAISIDGTCPGRLRYLHDAAALGTALPDAALSPLGAAQPIDAARLAGALADNYARARECAAQLNALIDWHQVSNNQEK